jgi:hypothetical protein
MPLRVVRWGLPATPDRGIGSAILPDSLQNGLLVSGAAMGLESHRGGPAFTLGPPRDQACTLTSVAAE